LKAVENIFQYQQQWQFKFVRFIVYLIFTQVILNQYIIFSQFQTDMKKLVVYKTPNTPSVNFDPDSGRFEIEGRSIPENPGDFFDPLLNWLNEYFKSPAKNTVFNLNLDYVNSGSSKYLLGLFKVFKKYHSDGIDIEINWFYEEDDEAIESLGEHYLSILHMPFNMKEYI
jgi:hypothetical protein